ncbi:hypothetical protein BDV18DRAFT_102424 [Aspergillus unguis]
MSADLEASSPNTPRFRLAWGNKVTNFNKQTKRLLTRPCSRSSRHSAACGQKQPVGGGLHGHFGLVHGETTQRGFSAVTDGQLQDISTGQIRAVVECKRAERETSDCRVDMQEAGIEVALIREYPHPDRRALVAQDGRSIYVSLPTWDEAWYRYVTQDPDNPAGFMRMNRIGPWDIFTADQVDDACRLLLAISL